MNKQFYNPIPSIYVASQEKPIELHLNLSQLDSSAEFEEIISKRVPIDNVYTVFVKIRYNQDEYRMVGNQFGFDYDSKTAS